MREILYGVVVVDNMTKKQHRLKVWAEDVEEATSKLTNSLLGYYNCYRWIGAGPIHDSKGEVITREINR